MKITVAQQNYLVADIEGNTSKVINVIRQSEAPVVVFAEGAVTGSPLFTLELDVDTALLEIAAVAPDKEVFIGLDTFQIAYISGGQIQIIDNNMIQVGNAAIIFEADHFRHGAPLSRLNELQSEAAESELVTIRVNQVGASTDTVYYGGTAICYPTGESITLPLWQECVDTIDTDQPVDQRNDWGSPIEQVHQAILLAIRDYFAKNGFRNACVALSGGIDSAIVVALAVEALGAERVRVILLPSAYSSDHSIDDSLEMVRRCSIEHNIIGIEPVFQQALKQLEPIFSDTQSGLAEENMQSRIRLMLTMALSNKSGALMLNTSNKSEAAVGYGTLYGDTSGALGVIADLYKGEVYDLARHINKVSGNLIPQNIIDKEPSAELRPDQKDSDSLPEYHILDAILYRLVEQRIAPAQIIEEGFSEHDVLRTARLLWMGDFKRKQLPPAIRLSGATFGVEYVMPITKKLIIKS